MIKFIKKTIPFSIPLLIAAMIVIMNYGITLPNLSNSLSFNAKMLFIKEKEVGSELDVLAIGSSMTLNNIHSETIANNYGQKYLNISSWGQSIEDDYRLIQILAKEFKPNTIIIATNFMDFENKPIKIKFDLLSEYLFEKNPLSGFDLRYNIQNSDDYQKYLQDVNGYEYLKYDKYGGINLTGHNLKVDSERWQGRNLDESQIDLKHYNYLDSIANYCKKKDISLVFVQSPFREGYYTRLKEHQHAILVNHTDKVNSILKKHDHQFVNTLDSVWPDSLFVDYSHFNEKGARAFTEFFAE